jgi:hypothetical protein
MGTPKLCQCKIDMLKFQEEMVLASRRILTRARASISKQNSAAQSFLAKLQLF